MGAATERRGWILGTECPARTTEDVRAHLPMQSAANSDLPGTLLQLPRDNSACLCVALFDWREVPVSVDDVVYGAGADVDDLPALVGFLQGVTFVLPA